MKLIMCTKCNDVYSINSKELRRCYCGATAGKYNEDGKSARIYGDCALPLGMYSEDVLEVGRMFERMKEIDIDTEHNMVRQIRCHANLVIGQANITRLSIGELNE